MVKPVALPPLEVVKSLLDYDPDTGIFVWKVQRSGPSQRGAPAGSLNMGGYLSIGVAGRRCLAHRLAFLIMTGREPQNTIDHINHDRCDNRWSNLRDCTQAENNWNYSPIDYKPNCSSRYTGVARLAREGAAKWSARIMRDGVCYRLGAFDTEEAARDAYAAAKRNLHAIGA